MRAGSDPEAGRGLSGSPVHDAQEQPAIVVVAQVSVFSGQGRQQHVVDGFRGHRLQPVHRTASGHRARPRSNWSMERR